MPRILYRADGGHPVGTGHIQHMLRVMARLLEACPDVEAVLVTQDTDFTRKATAAAGMWLQIEYLPPAPLGVTPRLDADDFEGIAERVKPDVIVVDMLDTESEDMRRLRGLASTLVTLDDRGDGRLFADLICNFLVRDPDPSALDFGRTWLREGPEYAPLAPEFADVSRNRDEPERVRRVMVSMGGADAVGLAVKVAEDLLRVDDLDAVDFNVGPAFQNQAVLESTVSHAKWEARLHAAVPSLLPFYETADLAIVAGGITMHEVACCCVPSIAVCQPIDHQLFVASVLEAAGCMVNLGYGQDLSLGQIAAGFANLSADRARRQAMSTAGPLVCDGLGASRVAQLILSCWKSGT